MLQADHIRPDTYGGYYRSIISTVDGQATFFGLQKQSPKLHEMFRGFSLHRNYNYNPKLPQKLHAELDSAVTKVLTTTPSSKESSNLTRRPKIHETKRQQKDRLLQRERLTFFDDWASPHVRLPYESNFQ